MIAITGAAGFLGWHTRSVAKARGLEFRHVDRESLSSPGRLANALDGAAQLVHLAGVNRGSDDEVRSGNFGPAQHLADALRAMASPPEVVSFANSVQADMDNVYGDSKRRAARILGDACEELGLEFYDERLPNLFGEHGSPHYNSVVATFCHEIANGRPPVVHDDKRLRLLGVRDAVDRLLFSGSDGSSDPKAAQHRPEPTTITVTELLELLTHFHELYSCGDIPDLASRFREQLFNTYRSFTFPDHFPIKIPRHVDDRGALVETARVHGGGGQSFLSTTVPGVTRGQHFHLDKVERFVVVSGQARISLRRLFHTNVVTFDVDGDSPVILDMPTLWAHNITNTGTTTLYTQFWSNQLFDPDHPDTYPEGV